MKKKYIIGTVVALAVIGAGIYSTSNQSLPVETYEVKEIEHLEKFVEETAVVKAREQQEVYAINPGELTDIYVREGQNVDSEVLLGKLDEQNIKLQLEQLQANKTELDALYKETLKPADWQVVQEAKSSLEIATSNYQKAQKDFETAKALYASGAMDLSTFNQHQNAYEVQKNNVNIAKSQLSLVQKNVSKNVEAQLKARVEALNKNIAILENNLDRYSFKSLIAGIVTEIPFKKGQYIQPGMKVFEISDLDTLYLETEVLASDVKDLNIGGRVVVKEPELGLDFEGEITFIAPKAHNKRSDLGIEQKRVDVEMTFKGNPKSLKLNYELDVKLIIGERNNIISVPNSAIFKIDDSDYVFVIENNVSKLRKVELGLEGEENTEIIQGLESGEIIVDSPSDQLEKDMKVKVVS
ncbi:MAG: efflux RND transporter periplasmic adaptor subunit [Tissierellales bacterium]|jgi:HlyD family secretion protein|nr:efflux RND transporter periplasmic adaptor subunit [Tissierellales bacterium]